MLKKFANLQERSFEINQPDFFKALENRDFQEMSDIYNEMMRYNGMSATNGDDIFFFTEILDGYTVKFPFIAKAKIHAFGKHFYYALAKDYVYYDINEYPDDDGEMDIVFDLFQKDFIEAEKVELTEDFVTLTPKAIKQLNLSVGDVVKIRLDDEAFTISRYEKPLSYK